MITNWQDPNTIKTQLMFKIKFQKASEGKQEQHQEWMQTQSRRGRKEMLGSLNQQQEEKE